MSKFPSDMENCELNVIHHLQNFRTVKFWTIYFRTLFAISAILNQNFRQIVPYILNKPEASKFEQYTIRKQQNCSTTIHGYQFQHKIEHKNCAAACRMGIEWAIWPKKFTLRLLGLPELPTNDDQKDSFYRQVK